MQIPDDKKFFRIGEVSRIIGVEPYVLRYWESEFPQIRPLRADSKQRTYQKRDLEIILEIKRLLYEEKLTIEGARQRLKHRIEKSPPSKEEILEDVKKELQDILRTLTE
ncbi:MAG: MerR family transcriptional regulator [Deltaproteobacteria bacterium HGW-Deltaproteobacteria-21]|jgi:DNA-binding transcriptional MerR regulator|nr:MerR family transcriptional regulator [Desulfobacterales bacterium]PKN29790.1 MAG: MerR family transcriptional regulator [Deltaproteobacteria bacterium HGW-Deltaproteobacteria-21]PKN62315.1 MAG: MerR family transcriptional regulator [Deltaproteobacteria bacterium HGW-Deltaproteobacteria-15]